MGVGEEEPFADGVGEGPAPRTAMCSRWSAASGSSRDARAGWAEVVAEYSASSASADATAKSKAVSSGVGAVEAGSALQPPRTAGAATAARVPAMSARRESVRRDAAGMTASVSHARPGILGGDNSTAAKGRLRQ